MRQFTDTTGHPWTLTVTVSALKRIKAATGLDLTQLVNPGSDVLERLAGDVCVLFDALCAALQPQLMQIGLSPDAFGERLDEAAAEAASTALIEATVDFFPPQKRAILHQALAKVKGKTQEQQTTAMQTASELVNSQEFDEIIERAMSGERSTDLRESSGLTLES